ncbi:MAG: UDP-N-acetylmuramate--L-alanine ligase [Chlamydiae bacterium]|nr:UDP-N-acetylmuramate--L-alanine ligase [Chlamydiota bacterium]
MLEKIVKEKRTMKKYHFIGIGGIGMSALARILLGQGYSVSGSDQNDSAVIQQLKELGAKIYLKHRATYVRKDQKVIYGSGIQETNSEFAKAKSKQLPMLHRADLLAHLLHGKSALLVAGSHGKTTTSSLLAHALKANNTDPSFAIGGIVKSLGTNGHHGSGKYFVAEADESDGTFLRYGGMGAIITNIGNDHLNFWKTPEALILGFKQFSKQIDRPEYLFWCRDSLLLRKAAIDGISYGFEEGATLRIESFIQVGWQTKFTCHFLGKKYEDILIPLTGRHNVLNACAVFGLLLQLRFPENEIRSALQSFEGVGRRMEKKGEASQIVFYDDYGHHPNEIAATLLATKTAVQSQRLVVVFQPHRYTRTKDCMQDFANAFSKADELIITDIYSAGEEPIEGINSQALVEVIRKNHAKSLQYVAKEDLVSFLQKFVRPNDVVLTLGAGDITKIGPQVIERLI